MIERELLPDSGVLLVRPNHPLAPSDFESLASTVDPYVEQHGPLGGMMIEANEFPGWRSLSGFIAHVRFVSDHHKKIRRVAVVTDDSTLSALPAIASHFVAAEVRHFRADERAKALTWLEAE